MPSQTEIVNMALTHLGQESVSSIDSDSDNAIKSKLIWDGCRDEVLRACPWSFATVISALNEYASDTIVGWDYVYAYPPKCLFIRKVYSDYNQNIIDLTSSMSQLPQIYLDESFKVVFNPSINLKVIVCNISPAYAEYTYQVTDPSVWDSLFIKAMSLSLHQNWRIIWKEAKNQQKEILNYIGLPYLKQWRQVKTNQTFQELKNRLILMRDKIANT